VGAVAKYRSSFYFFLLLSWLGILFVFRSATWGEGFIAPLDLSSLFTKFRWLNPSAGAIPANHYVVDLLDYELPRQFLAHQAIQSGEFPWWNPYTHGGIPFAAEAHIGLTDPTRFLLYHLLPFEWAFNWTLILHSFFSGMTAWLLLRHLKFSPVATLIGSLSYQFATSHALFIFPQSVQGSFLFYPLLWMAWSSWMKKPSISKIVYGGIAIAAILFSGNQQSHTYLPIFIVCFCAGYGGWPGKRLFSSVMLVAVSFAIGCALALPILIPQVEIYLLSTRELLTGYKMAKCLAGVLSLAAVFPWSLGTFRTLDLGKAVDNTGLGFAIYVGSAGVILALCGMTSMFRSKSVRPELRTAAFLLFAYLVGVCSTPLLGLLYTRASGLAVIGLVVFLAAGVDYLIANPSERILRRLRVAAFAGVTLLVLALHLFALAIFPRIRPKVIDYVLTRDQNNASMDVGPALRTFQVNNLPNEITFKNPEVLLAFASVASLLLVSANSGRNRWKWGLILLLNTAPMLLYYRRFVPCHPVEQWKALLRGGPEQQFLQNVAGKDLRIAEVSPGRFEDVFPGVTALYYRVHTLNGYATFYFERPGQKASSKPANFVYTSQERGLERGSIQTNTTENLRYTWSDKKIEREVRITRESFNQIDLHVGAGPAAQLVRNDTYYPGWRLSSHPDLRVAKNADGLLAFDLSAEETKLTLVYTPSYLRMAQGVAALTGLGCLLILGAAHVKGRNGGGDAAVGEA
jgi:hypothetical protein